MDKQKQGFAPILVILIIVAVIGVIFLAGKEKFGSSVKFGDAIPTATLLPTTILPEESIKEGVYINTKYGFQFMYPNKIFSNTLLNTYTKGFYRQFFISGPGLTDQLNLVVNTDAISIKNFEDSQKLPFNTPYPSQSSYINKPKNEWPSNIVIKTRDLNLGNYSVVVTYNYPSGGGISEGEAFWNATWKAGDKIYGITLLTQGRSSLDKYTVIFNNIVDSFKLIGN